MPKPGQESILQRMQKQSPYHQMAQQGLDSLEEVQRSVRAFVERERQTTARRRVADMTFQGVDADASLSLGANTYGVIRIPNNQTWKCMRVAASSSPNDVMYIYRGAPQPQNIVEKITCGADGFYVDSFANDLYMAAGSLMIVESTLKAVNFHVNLEIERMIPYMLPVSADGLLEEEMNQTPHDHGYDYDWPSTDPVEATAPERHMNAVHEDPADQPDISQADATVAGSSAETGQPGLLLPDVSAHLPAKPVV